MGSAVFGENEAYDPATGTWATFAPMPTPRHGLGVVTLGDAVYVASGGPAGGATYGNTLEIFSLP